MAHADRSAIEMDKYNTMMNDDENSDDGDDEL